MKGIRAAGARLGLRTKLFAGIIVALVLMVVMVGSFVLTNQQRLLRAMVADSLQAAQQVVESKLVGRAEQALGVSLAVAGMPEVIAAAASQDRAAIVDTVVAIYEEVHDTLGVDVLHIRAPYDTSLVRGQNPGVFGDVQSRGGILDAGREGRAIWGFDRGPFGMGMRGLAPIQDPVGLWVRWRPISPLPRSFWMRSMRLSVLSWWCLCPAKKVMHSWQLPLVYKRSRNCRT